MIERLNFANKWLSGDMRNNVNRRKLKRNFKVKTIFVDDKYVHSCRISKRHFLQFRRHGSQKPLVSMAKDPFKKQKIYGTFFTTYNKGNFLIILIIL